MAREDYKTEWVNGVLQQARQFGLIFVQLGATQAPLVSLVCEQEHCFSVEEYVSLRAGARGATPTFVLGLRPEKLGEDPKSPTLGLLRERVMDDMAAGGRVVLVSAAPRVAYPPVPGSSLLEDAKFVAGPLAPIPVDANAVPEAVLPVCRENESPLQEVLEASLRELGLEVCASLDHALFEAALDPADLFSTLTSREVEALRGASLVRTSTSGPEWTMPLRISELRDALSEVLSDQTETQEALGAVFASLWSIERSVRRALRIRAIELWGARWRRQVLAGDLKEKVEGRAKTSAYAVASSISQIRDPLEWLTMGELLETRARSQIGDLGLEEPLWKTLANEVLPVRNQISHMRLLRPTDLGTVLKWAKVVQVKLR
ncbi:hypothetical protein [Curtobacterium sp. ZW137]|uniref:hypothetical protein n=1 Tax=Curtobacterium sp. ZW137 TaxID=2485104 RepID=UPI000F4B04CA|nr:hypothetical protein [Curtobacterium sp. ZW137]ROP63677.1 hypothetical protein EDF55_2441 [Curtobacterium sp. ZW137]